MCFHSPTVGWNSRYSHDHLIISYIIRWLPSFKVDPMIPQSFCYGRYFFQPWGFIPQPPSSVACGRLSKWNVPGPRSGGTTAKRVPRAVLRPRHQAAVCQVTSAGDSRRHTSKTGWWFQIFFVFTLTWGRFPIWLIFFQINRLVQPPPR